MLLHSFQPAQAKRLGLEPEGLLDRYPRLIVSAVTPYGSTGPYAEWRGYAIQAQAGSAVASRVGAPDREPLTSAFDQAEMQHGAVHVATATVLALVHRSQTGRGQFVDVSVLDAVTVAISGFGIPRIVYAGALPPERAGRRYSGLPWGVMATSDGELAAMVLLDHQWRRFLELIGSPEWGKEERYRTVELQGALSYRTEEDPGSAGGAPGGLVPATYDRRGLGDDATRAHIHPAGAHRAPGGGIRPRSGARVHGSRAGATPHPGRTGRAVQDVGHAVGAAGAAAGARRPAGDRVVGRAGVPA